MLHQEDIKKPKWHTVVYLRGGVWSKYQTTYYPSFAITLVGALVNNNSFKFEGIKVLVTDSNDESLKSAILELNIEPSK